MLVLYVSVTQGGHLWGGVTVEGHGGGEVVLAKLALVLGQIPWSAVVAWGVEHGSDFS